MKVSGPKWVAAPVATEQRWRERERGGMFISCAWESLRSDVGEKTKDKGKAGERKAEVNGGGLEGKGAGGQGWKGWNAQLCAGHYACVLSLYVHALP